MTNTLDIGAFVYSRLSASNELKALLGEATNIYPLVADNDVKGAFIVYRRANLESLSTKDFYKQDKAAVEITIVTKKYAPGIEIAKKVRSLMEFQEAIYDDLNVQDCHIAAAEESFENEMFVQKMTFAMTVE